MAQAMCPYGARGRLFAIIMEWLNTPAYRRGVAVLDLKPGDSLLEIGFGTGAFLTRLATQTRVGTLAGVDPSELMVHQARRRLEPFLPHVRIDVRRGTDETLDWPDQAFSHVVALHSFQFWRNPGVTLTRIQRLLRPSGQLLLVLRSHARGAPHWLPNPISRAGNEVEDTLNAMNRAGFVNVHQHAPVKSSAVLTATTRQAPFTTSASSKAR